MSAPTDPATVVPLVESDAEETFLAAEWNRVKDEPESPFGIDHWGIDHGGTYLEDGDSPTR